MIVKDLRTEFYFVLKEDKKVLVVVNYDIDAICACKILQTLFKADYIKYTLVPVDASNNLRATVKENMTNENCVIFINCGGTLDFFQEGCELENITYFIVDSHRPLDLYNVHVYGEVKLLAELDETIPEIGDIFRAEGSDSENVENDNVENNHDHNEDEEVECHTSKRQRLSGKQDSKRQTRREWEEMRDKLLFNYSKLGYYGRSSALIMYELAWKMSKDNFDLLWYAIVGLSEQFLMRKIDEKEYLSECGDVQSHIARLTHRCSLSGEGRRNTAVRIGFEKDLRLALVRHWTVKSSLTYSAFTATRLMLWTFQGEKRLHEMLAEIGIPLIQCNQKYSSMDLIFRKEFQGSLEKMTAKYSLNGITFASFVMQHGFRAKYSAMDYVYSLIALIQSHGEERPKADCFLECLEALSRTKKQRLDQGIELAKNLLTAVFRQVQNALEMKQIMSAGPFLYLVLQEGNADPMLCNHPYGIFLLAEFALKAHVAATKTNKSRQLPLIVSAPCNRKKSHSAAQEGDEDDEEEEEEEAEEEEEEALCYIVGVAPPNQEKNINFFGKAFRRAAENSLCPIWDNHFDAAVIKLNIKDRTRFLDALAVLLKD